MTSVYHSHVIMEGPVLILILDLIVIANQDGMWQHIVVQIMMSANLCHVLMEELVITCLTNSRVIVLADMRVIYVKRVSIEGVTHTCTRRDRHGRDDNLTKTRE